MWEHAGVPEMGAHPQDALDDQLIAKSDLLVAIFWTRIGTQTARHISGTIQEIESFITRKGPKRVMIYFIDKPVNSSPLDLDLSQIQQLKEYKNKIKDEGLLCNVPDESAFRLKLYQHLESKVSALLRGELPEPSLPDTDIYENDDNRWPCDQSINGICAAFERYWIEMCARGDRFRDEGARLAARFARAIDRYLAENQFIITESDKHFLREQSHALKQLHLNARSTTYRKAVPKQYWDDGMAIAEKLSVHGEFMSKR
jgi:hypothetical protein